MPTTDEVTEAHRPKRVRCARVEKERTGRFGANGEEIAPPAGPKRVRCARVEKKRTGRFGANGEEIA
ncbi:MAG: hypothetical protein ACK5UT_06515, partial [Acidobacteriota bacterium]